MRGKDFFAPIDPQAPRFMTPWTIDYGREWRPARVEQWLPAPHHPAPDGRAPLAPLVIEKDF